MAGAMLAVPVSVQVQQLATAGGQTKLPTPHLPRPAQSAPVKQLTPKASPAPSTCLRRRMLMAVQAGTMSLMCAGLSTALRSRAT
ncbi:hypothetical protein CERSUDRAFT_120281 [Gelatoporia subvermispora B]|uniref:Uncharacterized protein n=1 Tax=Ceriporiopsis subvermispora (strain B) TaxID=914234 RepID=M2QFU7_CERS8|nr:hypothetical protein CERSUDRAFT_120281 [Gelatoporia subvermispora B]